MSFSFRELATNDVSADDSCPRVVVVDDSASCVDSEYDAEESSSSDDRLRSSVDALGETSYSPPSCAEGEAVSRDGARSR